MNILIADDDISTRLSLSLIAEKWGYTVTSANDGLEVLRILQSVDPPPQLLILDWQMPGMDGPDVCRQIRHNPQTSSAYVLMLTSRDEKNDVLRGLEAGADDYITKPFSPDILRARLKTGERLVGLQNDSANQIKELKRTIEQLRQTEATLEETKDYRNLFKHANDSIIVFDSVDGAILKVNDKACDTYQIPREKFVGMSILELSDDDLRHEEMVNTVIQQGKAEEFEVIHLRADRKPMNILVNSSFVEFEGREAVLSVNRDVTDRREIEMLVERALQEWSATVDAVSDLIILTDAEARIRRCNKATTDFFHRGFGDVIGQNLYEICGFNVALKTVLVTYDPLNEKIWEGKIIGHPDDWFEITNHQVELTKSGQTGAHRVHIIKNITERKRAEARLNLLNTAVEQAADSVIVTDVDGVIEYVNPAFVACTGWSQQEAQGRKMLDLHPELLAALQRDNPERLLPNKAWHDVYRAHKKNGETYDEEITVSPVRRRDGRILNYVAVCRDVTEKRRLESIAEAVNMMQNVGYIFSGIRHELGNPINSVKTALTVLKKNLDKWQTAQIDTYINRCLTETERVEYLLRALKTFSMHENPRMEAVPLTAFMENFVSLVKSDFENRGVEIQLASTNEIGEALFDPRALHQVLLNLITNAVDSLEGRDEPLITISFTEERKRISVCIEDNGAGMSEPQVENLFKPFYTSKENGTGLGLVIVKKMITRMNGTIHVESEMNEGTRVYFTLEAAN